ncbi:hypothetical protein [Prochlorococcus sp. MIT 1307]|uniref:hypothetical protein n=1 Tax=Prochlorococcus sp. MIT 1307 TaxID=3096219 RepID=UPI002A763BD5|nr:hypothetical protein [Prochlorococcus sp. MIT 1307]
MHIPSILLEIGPFSDPMTFSGLWFASWLFTWFSGVSFNHVMNKEMYSTMAYSESGKKINRNGDTPKAVWVAALWALPLAIYISHAWNRCPVN